MEFELQVYPPDWLHCDSVAHINRVHLVADVIGDNLDEDWKRKVRCTNLKKAAGYH